MVFQKKIFFREQTQTRKDNVKNAKFDWTTTAMSLTTSSRSFFGFLEHASLTAIKSAFGLDIILVYTLKSKYIYTKEVTHPLLLLRNPPFNIS